MYCHYVCIFPSKGEMSYAPKSVWHIAHIFENFKMFPRISSFCMLEQMLSAQHESVTDWLKTKG